MEAAAPAAGTGMEAVEPNPEDYGFNLVQTLGGDCHSPIGALAQMEEGQITLRVRVGTRGGIPPVISASAVAPADHADGAVGEVLKSLSDQNVQSMLGQ